MGFWSSVLDKGRQAIRSTWNSVKKHSSVVGSLPVAGPLLGSAVIVDKMTDNSVTHIINGVTDRQFLSSTWKHLSKSFGDAVDYARQNPEKALLMGGALTAAAFIPGGPLVLGALGTVALLYGTGKVAIGAYEAGVADRYQDPNLMKEAGKNTGEGLFTMAASGRVGPNALAFRGVPKMPFSPKPLKLPKVGETPGLLYEFLANSRGLENPAVEPIARKLSLTRDNRDDSASPPALLKQPNKPTINPPVVKLDEGKTVNKPNTGNPIPSKPNAPATPLSKTAMPPKPGSGTMKI